MQGKFRVWLMDMMWYNDTIVDLAGGKQRNLMLTMDGEVRICNWKDGKVGIQSPEFFHLKAIVQFSTGLKDGKNNEIYSKDVVEYFTTSGYERAVVEYIEDLAAWGLMPIGKKLNKGEVLFTIGGDAIEIIGNIFESPEALE